MAPAESASHIESAVFTDRPPRILATTPSAMTEGRGRQVCSPDVTFCPLPFLHPAPLKKPSGLRSRHSALPLGSDPFYPWAPGSTVTAASPTPHSPVPTFPLGQGVCAGRSWRPGPLGVRGGGGVPAEPGARRHPPHHHDGAGRQNAHPRRSRGGETPGTPWLPDPCSTPSGGQGPLPARLLSWKLTSHAQNHFPTKGPSLGSYYL